MTLMYIHFTHNHPINNPFPSNIHYSADREKTSDSFDLQAYSDFAYFDMQRNPKIGSYPITLFLSRLLDFQLYPISSDTVSLSVSDAGH